MPTTRAKFKVSSIKRSAISRYNEENKLVPYEVRTVEMYPVSDKEGENAKFWNATPSGKIELGCANAAAVELFDLEKEYYVDFSPAE